MDAGGSGREEGWEVDRERGGFGEIIEGKEMGDERKEGEWTMNVGDEGGWGVVRYPEVYFHLRKAVRGRYQ